MHYDVFNGDADGILALVQLRLAEPKEAILITGVKRDIQLLQRVDVKQAKSVTVLDISLEKNIDALEGILNENIPTFYVDHHRPGSIPTANNLHAIINTDANTCTSLLMNEYLNNAYVNWAIAAAFGDNMIQSAEILANKVGLPLSKQKQLKALGIYINYNGYGRDVGDLHFHPADLFKQLIHYTDPLILINEDTSIFHQLEKAYQQDMIKALSAKVIANDDACKVVQLDDEAWARRVSGVFGNELANKNPNKAHAVLTLNNDATYTVSVRAPLNNKVGADEVCIQFPTGGGRSGAAGINQLPQSLLTKFIDTLSSYYQSNSN